MKENEKGLLAAAVFIGIFFWSKVKEPSISSRTPPIPSGPAIATRLPKAYARIEGFSDQKSPEQIMRENKAKKKISRAEQMRFKNSMTHEQQKAYLASRNITMGDK